MSIAVNTPAVLEYPGNGTANIFAITFPTFEIDTIEVQVAASDGTTQDLTLGVHYSLTGVGLPNTNASLTLTNGAFSWLSSGNLATGYTLYIKFSGNTFQPGKFRDLGRFSPETFEKSLDRLAMSIKAVNARVGKALGLQFGDGGNASLPPLAGNAAKMLKVNDSANGFVYSNFTEQDFIDARTAAQTAATNADSYRVIATNKASDAANSATAAASSAAQANVSASNAATSQTAAATSASGAAASQSAAALSQIQANNAVVDAQAARDAAIAAANDTTIVGTYKTQTQGYRDQALTYSTNAGTSATNAASSATAAANSASAAATSATNANTSATNAAASVTAAQTAATNAQTYEQQSDLWSSRLLYEHIVPVSTTPFTVDDDIYQETYFVVDTTAGNVTINLPQITATFDDTNWKAGFVIKGPNSIILHPYAGDTMMGSSGNTTLSSPYLGAVIYANSPTDWKVKYFSSSANAADAIPVGGNAGDILVKNSSANGDVKWAVDNSIINALIFG